MNYDLNPANLGQTFVRFVFGVIDMQLLIGLIVASADKENRRTAVSKYFVKKGRKIKPDNNKNYQNEKHFF